LLDEKMEYIYKFKELEKYFEKADYTDVKVFESKHYAEK
jgi:hypothetical protein